MASAQRLIATVPYPQGLERSQEFMTFKKINPAVESSTK